MHRSSLLPLITYPDSNTERAVQNAVAFVQQIGGALHGMAINVDIPDVSNAVSRYLMNLPQMIYEAEATSRQHGRDLLTALAGEASAVGLSLTTEETAAAPAFMGEVTAMKARYFDLAIVSWMPGNQTVRMVSEAVLFGSGRPMLLFPEVATVSAIDHVAIAWDGSRVAARAVADAQMFLDTAAKVSVITVIGEKALEAEDIGDRLASGLVARGVPATAVSIMREAGPIGDTLQNHALEMGTKLLVMGGYGHSRVRDFVLGGATESVLNDVRLPILLTH
ncbi:universal stress protein [Mesorhizobium sp.]|jgi:nucleotide-binding universal stress UspA family protein|uniref:universal stress protein n=1 Tax=Mesorhizobium sp. TaxID=1871066 RepID=UPI00356186DC